MTARGLQELREASGLKVGQLAAMLGIRERHLYRLLADDSTVIREPLARQAWMMFAALSGNLESIEEKVNTWREEARHGDSPENNKNS